ncbi:hypothetical protein BCR36DRAFT_334709 [Piromyces finnis]|uniref:MICOS complex subunit n=1 Tax=Piromyces finnis TaxID=1754191 RepID=A0A1Y1UZZ5_9FUNG|nr:hypothetical protein BCR36DRAFT_334709 [Piromyces finnis]|eukprot:ORX44323.1 hypothetical protein BCR36DRAFT_334709 [Piromyces finnis]
MSFLQNLKNKINKYVPEKERKAYPNLLYISALGVTGSIISRKSNAFVRTVTPISLMLAGTYVWYPQTSKNVYLSINNRMKTMIQNDKLKNTLSQSKNLVEGKIDTAAKTFKATANEVKGRVNKVQKEAKKELKKVQNGVEKIQKDAEKVQKSIKDKVEETSKQIKEVKETSKQVKNEIEKTQKDLNEKIEKAKN